VPVAALINGPIASGKSAVAHALQRILPGSILIEGDEHDAPSGLSMQARWTYTLWRITQAMERALDEQRPAIIAWPASDTHYHHLYDTAQSVGGHLYCVTLRPPMAVALSGRGRSLSIWERERVRAMYDEGYADRGFSDLILDSAALDLDRCARVVAGLLRL